MTKYLLIVALLLAAIGSRAQQSVFTIGPKIGYAFGESGGITLGFEASYFPNVKDPANDFLRYGFTAAATFWEDHMSFHLGAEAIVALALGIDMGPTLIINDQGSSIGLGTIAFAGAIVYPYYEVISFAHVRPESIGAYVKMPPNMWVGNDGWWALH